MGAKRTRRRARRMRPIEHLEPRCVMSAGTIGTMVPLLNLQDGSIQHLGLADLQIGPPALVHHAERDADFWIDWSLERDLETLFGDVQQTLYSAHGVTGLTQVRNDYGFIGNGQTVAVIDSGIAWNHLALGGGFGPNYRVVGGRDFTEENDSNPYDDGPAGGHGTHVAGIVGADRTGTADDGVAPGVDLVALRVFNDAGDGYFSWVENALRWVYQNRNAFANPITAVNLSLGTAWNSSTIPSWAMLEEEFQQLKAAGVFISVSAGNSFASYNTPGLSYPAASSYVVPVMSVDDTGSFSSFSQRHTRAIAAPGRWIVSTIPDYIGNQNGVADDYASFSGTSMAAPYVAGASVLLREAMQFVGYTNITQDTIYNHMMATATSFYDTATAQTYKRLNLANAFDTLMPADDYGSTVATAHTLGTLRGTSQISGLVGKLSDADYFTFTAASTGSISFTATTTHTLAPVWTAHGGSGTVSGNRGQIFTMNVVAGQSYTLGLSTSGGIGYYTLAINAPHEFTYTDWGTITQTHVNNVNHVGETWYRLRASSTGYLTAEVFFAGAGGNVDITLYRSNLQALRNGTDTIYGERLDAYVTAGADYFLRVTGTNTDVDFRLTNLVSYSGSTVSVAGTAGVDTFSYAVSATQYIVGVNGLTYQFTRPSVTQISFAGGAGTDSITLTGSSKKETAVVRPGNASFAGSGFVVSATGVENITLNSGGGKDVVHLYDSAGDDVYRAYHDYVLLTGTGYAHRANGFKTAVAYASSGSDSADMHGSIGKDVYRAYRDRVAMTGRGFANTAHGFDTTFGYAVAGVDKAYMYDSPGDDVYLAYADRVEMSGTGYENRASGFAKTYAYSSTGGDVAHMYDSAGNDLYRRYSSRVVMSGPGYSNTAYRFPAAYGYSSSGNDTMRTSDFRGTAGHLAPESALHAMASFAGGPATEPLAKVDSPSITGLTRTYRDAVVDSFVRRAWQAHRDDHSLTFETSDFAETEHFLRDQGEDPEFCTAIDLFFESVGAVI